MLSFGSSDRCLQVANNPVYSVVTNECHKIVTCGHNYSDSNDGKGIVAIEIETQGISYLLGSSNIDTPARTWMNLAVIGRTQYFEFN